MASDSPSRPGWGSLRELKPYHWFVFVVCCLAWDLDCMDQQLFVLARNPAVETLLGPDRKAEISSVGANATAVFMVGWAIGGIGFGVLGDRIGRVKTLTATIFLYALFTGLSAFSYSVTDFMVYRLLTGLGVGGAFAAAVVLLAETVPDRPRPYVLGLFQASSVIGNCTAALINMYMGSLQKDGAFTNKVLFTGHDLTAWRVMFLIGIIPGLLLVIVQFTLREPDKWVAMRDAERAGARKSPIAMFFGTLTGLLTAAIYGRRVLFGLLLTAAGVIGLWGIGFFSPDLVGGVLTKSFEAEGLSGDALKGEVTRWRGITSLIQNGGAFLGIFAFSWVTGIMGRKSAFALFFVLAAASTAITFWFINDRSDVYWMIPLMGFCQLALFGGYAIYLPELFPTRFRSTGTSFCYNAGRFLAAAGPFTFGMLIKEAFSDKGADAIRYAGVSMCVIFLLGLLALPFLPETKDKPLPE